MKTYEDALIASVYIELETGTQRSVGALYGLLLPFMSYKATGPLPEKYINIHKAVRKQWPGKRNGLDALDKIKTIGWKNYDKLAALQASARSNTDER